jgi:hypothetical protein
VKKALYQRLEWGYSQRSLTLAHMEGADVLQHQNMLNCGFLRRSKHLSAGSGI